MNAKDFIRLGIPLGEATRRASDFIPQFILSGGDKSRLEGEWQAIVANPSLFAEDPLRKELAKAIANAPPPPRVEPVKYRQWGEGLEHEAAMQMEKACLLPVAVAGALMPDAHVGYGLPIGGVLATENAVIPYAVGVDIACRMKMTVLDVPVRELERHPERLTRAIEAETRFGVVVLGFQEGQEYWAAMELRGRYAAANHALIHKHVAANLGAKASEAITRAVLERDSAQSEKDALAAQASQLATEIAEADHAQQQHLVELEIALADLSKEANKIAYAGTLTESVEESLEQLQARYDAELRRYQGRFLNTAAQDELASKQDSIREKTNRLNSEFVGLERKAAEAKLRAADLPRQKQLAEDDLEQAQRQAGAAERNLGEARKRLKELGAPGDQERPGQGELVVGNENEVSTKPVCL